MRVDASDEPCKNFHGILTEVKILQLIVRGDLEQGHVCMSRANRSASHPSGRTQTGALFGRPSRTVCFTASKWQRRNHECVSLPPAVTMVVPGPPLLVTSGNSLLRFHWNTRESRQITALALEPARVRLNDGTIDPGSRLCLGTDRRKEPDRGL